MTALMIYGAYGYTGELMVREAVKRGMTPIIAGRSAAKLASLAEELSLEARVFEAANAAEHLAGVGTMLNCAGPFTRTAAPIVDACIAQGVHYTDITGEIDVFAYCHDRDQAAREAGVVLCPGTGFDIVPTDCLAATLKGRMPDAETINLAFSFGTKPSIGTATTALEAAEHGGMIRRNHKIETVANSHDIRRISFPGGKKWAATMPWGDVFTSEISTGTPNCMVYAALPLPAGVALRAMTPFRKLMAKPAVQKRLTNLIGKMFAGGPDDQARADQRTEFWGEAINPDGKTLALHFSAPNVYSLTVDTAVEIASFCMTQTSHSGYQTASMLMGADFISLRPGVSEIAEVKR